MRRARHGGRIAAALLAAIALTSPAFAGKADNSVRFAFDQAPENVDPYFNGLRVGLILADQVWDTLIYRDPETGEFKGELATAWRWIDDKTLELDLRQGVRFHNGAEFDADDVIYTVSFISKPETNSLQRNSVRWIDHVEKVGKYRVRIVARQPFPAAIAYLAAQIFVIHPHEYYAKVGSKGMNEKPVGTGPFRVVEHAIGKNIRLERNRDYFRDSPKAQAKIDRVDIRFIPDAQTRVAEMVAGGLDLIMQVAPDQAEQLRGTPSLQVLSGGNTRSWYLTMNTMERTTAPQLRDIRVRQAIMHAIDRETMAKFLIGRDARVLHTECHPSQFGCDDTHVPRYAYDPAKARSLLAEAGLPNGFGIDLYAYRDRIEMEAIIGYLNAVGIKARLRYLTLAAVRSTVRAGRAAFAQQGWSSFASDVADSISRFHEFSSDDINRDPEIRDLLLRGDFAMDPEARKDAYAKALALIAERAYVVPLYSKPTYYLAAKDLAFRPAPDEFVRFNEMSYR